MTPMVITPIACQIEQEKKGYHFKQLRVQETKTYLNTTLLPVSAEVSSTSAPAQPYLQDKEKSRMKDEVKGSVTSNTEIMEQDSINYMMVPSALLALLPAKEEDSTWHNLMNNHNCHQDCSIDEDDQYEEDESDERLPDVVHGPLLSTYGPFLGGHLYVIEDEDDEEDNQEDEEGESEESLSQSAIGVAKEKANCVEMDQPQRLNDSQFTKHADDASVLYFILLRGQCPRNLFREKAL